MDKTKVNHFIFGLVIFLGRGPGTACFVGLCMGALVFWGRSGVRFVLWVCAWEHLFSGEGLGAVVFWVAWGPLFSGFVLGHLFSGW